jgi:hypothetical protein
MDSRIYSQECAMKKSMFFVVFSMSILIAMPAFAAYPLITDDSDTQGKGNFQIEVNGETGFDKETDAAGVQMKVRDSALATILSYGTGKDVDLVVGVLYRDYIVKENGEKVAAESGYSDVVVEVKWRFLEKDGFALAIKPGVILPSGNDQKGLGSGKTGYGAFLIASKELEPLTVLVNIGYIRNENKVEERVELWRLSAAAIYKATEHLKLVADIGQATGTDKSVDRYPAYALAGVIYAFSERFEASFGIKTGLNEPEADLSYRAGIVMRF